MNLFVKNSIGDIDVYRNMPKGSLEPEEIEIFLNIIYGEDNWEIISED